MKKNLLASVDGWTPIIDELAKQYGLIRAAVFGTIWRYCQMSDGVCKAKLETIAEHLGVDKATVQRHAQELVNDQYLEDLTPGLRNRPHIYRDTGKVALEISVGVALCNATLQSATSDCTPQRHVAQSRLRKLIKKDIKIPEEEEAESATPLPNLFQVYEQEIGPLTPMIAEALKDAEDQHTEQWVIEAIHQASAHSARSWSYIKAILRRWAKDGYGKDNRSPKKINGNGHASTPLERSLQALKEFGEENGN